MKRKTFIWKMKCIFNRWNPGTEWDEFWQEVKQLLKDYDTAKNLERDALWRKSLLGRTILIFTDDVNKGYITITKDMVDNIELSVK